MPTLDLSLINAALTRCGDPTITSLDEGVPGSDIASANYEIVVLAELARSRYKLPTKFQQLNLIDEDEMGSPPDPWLYGYQLPTDLVKLSTIKVDGTPIEYEQLGRIIFCNYDETVEVMGFYEWRIPESWFAPEFSEGIVRRMEAIFLRGIGERHAEALKRDAAADEQFAFARSSDSQAQTPRQPVGSPALRARRGEVNSSGILRARRA